VEYLSIYSSSNTLDLRNWVLILILSCLVSSFLILVSIFALKDVIYCKRLSLKSLYDDNILFTFFFFLSIFMSNLTSRFRSSMSSKFNSVTFFFPHSLKYKGLVALLKEALSQLISVNLRTNYSYSRN